MKELSLTKFESMISNVNHYEITEGLWAQFVALILTSKAAKTNPKPNPNEFEYDGNPNHRFDGIIRHLQNNKEENLHKLGIINVTSDTFAQNHYPHNVIDFDRNNYFLSLSDCDWLKYDFKDKKIRPTSYSIKTRPDADYQNPVNWCIEVSNTGGDNAQEWRIMDSRTGIRTVSKRNQIDTFTIQTQLMKEESYRYIRLRSTGQTTDGNSYLAISSLEYFGTLVM